MCIRLLVLGIGLSSCLCVGAENPNLVINGDFSGVNAGGTPVRWKAEGDSTVRQTLTVSTEDGVCCAKLACTKFEGGGPSSHAMLAQVGGAALRKGKLYEFSCRAAERDMAGRSVTVAISDTKDWQNCGLMRALSLSPSFKPFRCVFRATCDVNKTGRLQIWFAETGTLLVADVKIVEIGEVDVKFTDEIKPTGSKNLVYNSSFELHWMGWSSFGQKAGWGNYSQLCGQVVPRDDGKGMCLCIEVGGDRSKSLAFDYPQATIVPPRRVLAASVGWIPVQKGKPYTVSADMRCGELPITAVLGVCEKSPTQPSSYEGRTILSPRQTLDKAWKRYQFTFTPTQPYVFVLVGPDLAQEPAEGKVVETFIDNVQLAAGEDAQYVPRSTVEVALMGNGVTEAPTPGQGMSICLVWACNHGGAPATISVELDARDFFDRKIELEPVKIDVPPHSMRRAASSLSQWWLGFCRVTGRWTIDGREDSQTVRLTTIPKHLNETILGINHAFSDRRMIDVARKAGVGWYRDWSLRWQAIEPSPGRIDWSFADREMDSIGTSIVALLPPFPSAQWSSEAAADLPTTGYPGIRIREAWAPKDPQKLGDYVAVAVKHYKASSTPGRPQIRTWEFLNEPIYTDYALPAKGKTRYGGKGYEVADYVALLKIAAQRMHAEDPGCKVIGGAAAPPGALSKAMIEGGCLQHVDIFNLHDYPTRQPESFAAPMDDLLAAMDKHGGRKPIWITEFSYYGDDDPPRTPFLPGENAWAEQRLLESERQCAEFTVRYMLVMLRSGVEKFFIHSGACGSANSYDGECCLFRYGGVPTKVMPAVAVLTSLLGPAPKLVAEKRVGGAWCLAFTTAQQTVMAVWDPNDGGKKMQLPQGVECVDIMGMEVKGPAILSTSPVYLTCAAGEWKRAVEAVEVELKR